MEHTEITLEAAVEKARRLLPGINHCTEYAAAYLFTDTTAPLSFGGFDSPAVILKESRRGIQYPDASPAFLLEMG